MTEHTIAPPEAAEHSSRVGTFAITNPPLVCAIVGAPFGDLEFDIGKSVRWLEYFSDQLFVLDVNRGDPRYWVINWTQTFPDAEHRVTGINYFVDPVGFRKEQFDLAMKEFNLDPESWVIWVDGSEGLSFDIRGAAADPDYNANPFMYFIWREIEAAEQFGDDVVTLPFFVFCRSDEIANVTYNQNITDPNIPGVLQPLSVPYYQPYQGLARLTKVSALLDNGFDWESIDTPTSPTPGVMCQIISYAYAHWNIQDVPPGETEVPPLSEANDDGYRMRKLISMARPIPGFQTAVWTEDDQPLGLAGPTAPSTTQNTHPDLVVVGTPGGAPDASTEALLTPLYDTVFRINLRDGVWYEAGVSGNTPLVWSEADQKWVPVYDPNEWASMGVDASLHPDMYPQARVALAGKPGTFTTSDGSTARTPDNLTNVNVFINEAIDEELIPITVLVPSVYAWKQGEYVVLKDESEAYFANERPEWFKVGRAPARTRLMIGETVQSADFNTDLYSELNNCYIGVNQVVIPDPGIDPTPPLTAPWALNQYATCITDDVALTTQVTTQVRWDGFTWVAYTP